MAGKGRGRKRREGEEEEKEGRRRERMFLELFLFIYYSNIIYENINNHDSTSFILPYLEKVKKKQTK